MKIKICGIRTAAAGRAAADCGADFIGCIFYRGSRRYIAPEAAAEILRSLKVKKVGVFVDEPADNVNRIVELAGLDYVQLHGRETAEYAAGISAPIIKAWRYGDNFSAKAANDFPCEFVLVDAFVAGAAGGTGKKFDWRGAAEEVAKVERPVFIAGGISAENFTTAAEIFKPFALDVSGSLETGGEKSVALIENFLRKVKANEVD